MLLRPLAAAAVALALAGCPPWGPRPAPGACTQRVLGDASQPMELRPVALQLDGGVRELRDGDPVALLMPPQGGFVVYAGARARNLGICNVVTSAHLLDPATMRAVTGLDERSAHLAREVDGFAGAADADLRFDLPNIPACPDALGRGVADKDALLEVTMTDATGKRGKATVRVRPMCPPEDPRCACICGPDYRTGGC